LGLIQVDSGGAINQERDMQLITTVPQENEWTKNIFKQKMEFLEKNN